MATVLLVVHLMIAAGLVGVVLLQKSEGGALGVGGGGGGGFMTGRGTANLLTRVTAGLAAAFFTTSILLTILAGRGGEAGRSLLDSSPVSAPAGTTTAPASDAAAPPASDAAGAPSAPAPAETQAPSSGGILDKLK
ncbi:MAG: preprotein translocase subunit SecG [Hyphomicrobiaceae bacterium]|nr:preprotein translocase subunit SecG [Hyphomicrobiaceae bacterium]